MLDEKIKYFSDSPLGMSMNGKYSNSIKLNGFVLQEPKYTINPYNKKESVSFIIHQIGKSSNGAYLDKTYAVICYIPELIAKAKELMTNACFVNVVCSLEWTPKKKAYSIQARLMEIPFTTDIEFEPPYIKAERE